jgi:mannose-6-phosphate isomerase-like protein (cupin superfamily)
MMRSIPEMLRRRFLAGCALSPVGFLAGQQATATSSSQPVALAPDQGGVVYWPAEDLRKAHATLAAAAAKGETKPGPLDLVTLPITRTHAYNFLCRYPNPSRPPRAEFHEGNSDVYFIVAGGAEIEIGGELVERAQVANKPGEYQGSSIKGGKSYRVKPGDILSIPPATAHLTRADPGGLSYMLLKVNVGMYPWSIVATQQNTTQPHVDVPRTPDQGGVVYWSAEDLKKAHAPLAAAAAKGETTPGPRDLVQLPITHTHAFNFLCRYPTARPSRVEYHEGNTDVYFMVAGSAEIVIGGDLVERQQVANMPGEYQGSSIRGGKSYRVKAGDILNIPPATAHWTHPDPGGLSYMLVKVNVGMYPWSIVATQQAAAR